MRGSCTLFVFFFTGVSCLSFSTPLSTISLTVRPCSAAFAFICLYSCSGISIVVLIKTPNHNYGRVLLRKSHVQLPTSSYNSKYMNNIRETAAGARHVVRYHVL